MQWNVGQRGDRHKPIWSRIARWSNPLDLITWLNLSSFWADATVTMTNRWRYCMNWMIILLKKKRSLKQEWKRVLCNKYIRKTSCINPYLLLAIILTLFSLSVIFFFWDFLPLSHCYPVKVQYRNRKHPLEGRKEIRILTQYHLYGTRHVCIIF